MKPVVGAKQLELFALRLKPGQDLRHSLIEFAARNDLRAGSVISGVGSLSQAGLRLAGRDETRIVKGPFEIVSLTGTVSRGGLHLHVSLSDQDGRTVGGHLKEGSLILTTAEITILDARDLEFARETDPQTGYPELTIRPSRT